MKSRRRKEPIGFVAAWLLCGLAMTAWYFVAPQIGVPPLVVKIGVLIWAIALVPASLWLAPRIDSFLYDTYGEPD